MAQTRTVAPASGMPRELKTMSSLREPCACAVPTPPGTTRSASASSAQRNPIVVARLKRDAIFDRIITILPLIRANSPSGSGVLKDVLCFAAMTDLNNLRIVVTLTRQDLYRANVSVAWKKRSWTRRLLSTLAFVAAASFLFFLTMSHADPPIDWLTALLMGSGLALGLQLLFWPLTLVAVHGLAYYGAGNLARSKPSSLQPVTYEFSPDGIFHIGSTGTGRANWTAYLRIRETSDQFLLYIQNQLANVLPKRAFQSEAEMHQFRQLVREHFHGEINFPQNS